MRVNIYEHALTRQGVTFSYQEKVPLGEIDTAKGMRNQARLEQPAR